MRHKGLLGWRYNSRCNYMITLVTEPRQPIFGVLREWGVERSDAGRAAYDAWQLIERRYPTVRATYNSIMPDHFHGILFVKERLDRPLGKVLLGFKQGCNKAFRELVPYVAVLQQQTEQGSRKHGLLFEPGYNDKVLLHAGQLKRWNGYLRDNPRRLLMKREHPDLFRVQRGLEVGGMSFSAIGNRFLLERPVLLQVQCSRRLNDTEIQERIGYFTKAAAKGAVLVSPSISPGEKAVMRAAFEQGYPLIYLQENGLTDLAKPGGQRMEACAKGQLLILAPWEHHNERLTIRRDQCLSLNEMARAICSVCCCTTATNRTADETSV